VLLQAAALAHKVFSCGACRAVDIDGVLEVISLVVHVNRAFEDAAEVLLIVLARIQRLVANARRVVCTSHNLVGETLSSGARITDGKNVFSLDAGYETCVARNALVADLMLRPTEPGLGVLARIVHHHLLLGRACHHFDVRRPRIGIKFVVAVRGLTSLGDVGPVRLLGNSVALANSNSNVLELERDKAAVTGNLLSAVHE